MHPHTAHPAPPHVPKYARTPLSLAILATPSSYLTLATSVALPYQYHYTYITFLQTFAYSYIYICIHLHILFLFIQHRTHIADKSLWLGQATIYPSLDQIIVPTVLKPVLTIHTMALRVPFSHDLIAPRNIVARFLQSAIPPSNFHTIEDIEQRATTLLQPEEDVTRDYLFQFLVRVAIASWECSIQ